MLSTNELYSVIVSGSLYKIILKSNYYFQALCIACNTKHFLCGGIFLEMRGGYYGIDRKYGTPSFLL